MKSIFLSLLIAGSLHGQIVLNGSFEVPGFTPAQSSDGVRKYVFAGQTFINNWTVGGIAIDYFSLQPTNIPANDGQFRVDLVRGPNQWGMITQTVSGLTVGRRYFLAFNILQGQIITNATIRVVAQNSFREILNPTPNKWWTNEIQFVAAATSAGVSFSALPTGSSDVGLFVDNIKFGTNSWLPPNLTIQVGDVDICWQSRSDKMYQLQYELVAGPGMWFNLGGPIQGNGVTNCVLESVRGQPKKFYRVIELP